MRIQFIIILLLGFTFIFGQKTTVSGKVTEVETGSPVPFATVIFIGTTEGAITDFDGNFTVTTSSLVDSISVTYIGFKKRTKAITRGQNQVVNLQLAEDVTTLMEIVVTPGENPALAVMRKVIENKDRNNKKNLSAYEYESYVRTEFDVDNITEEMRNRKFMTKILDVMDSASQIAGDDGKPILPVLMSEAISRFYYKNNPTAKHERILRTKVSGVGVTDGSLTSQLIGSTYQEYNFYQNWLNIVGKEFASPIANGWKLIYDYELIDSVYIGDKFCYMLEFLPKQELDLAFTGTMWITKDEYALKQVDAIIAKNSNLNFIDKIKVQQELQQTEVGPWLPAKTRVVIDFNSVSQKTAGLLTKFYISNRDVVVNSPKEDRFYLNSISMAPSVSEKSEEYWVEARHDSLSSTEVHLFAMIDTLKQIPVVRNVTETSKFLATGHIKAGKIDIGPYSTFFGNNNVEGYRLGMGARTNIDFSNKLTFGGYVGYGFDDERFKYKFYTTLVTNKDTWTEWKYSQQKEVDQIWLINEDIDPTSFFYTFSRFGTLTNPFLKNKYQLSFLKQIGHGLTVQLSTKHERLQPLFDFEYYIDDSKTSTRSNYEINEATLALHYGRDEIIIINDNERLSMGMIRHPIYDLSYSYGSDLFGGDFTYHKLKFSVRKRQKMGLFGISSFNIGAGALFGDVPYSLLFNPIGNETPFSVSFAYNLMDFFEFSASKYVEFRYRHSFEGFIFNRIPLFRRLKLRSALTANAFWGKINNANIEASKFEIDADNNPILPFKELTNIPYLEVGYGVENIFKVATVQMFHRLTYLDGDVNKNGVKFSFRLGL
ncbi:MAG: DUF5686 family protein [Ekhidna sp.]